MYKNGIYEKRKRSYRVGNVVKGVGSAEEGVRLVSDNRRGKCVERQHVGHLCHFVVCVCGCVKFKSCSHCWIKRKCVELQHVCHLYHFFFEVFKFLGCCLIILYFFFQFLNVDCNLFAESSSEVRRRTACPHSLLRVFSSCTPHAL